MASVGVSCDSLCSSMNSSTNIVALRLIRNKTQCANVFRMFEKPDKKIDVHDESSQFIGSLIADPRLEGIGCARGKLNQAYVNHHVITNTVTSSASLPASHTGVRMCSCK